MVGGTIQAEYLISPFCPKWLYSLVCSFHIPKWENNKWSWKLYIQLIIWNKGPRKLRKKYGFHFQKQNKMNVDNYRPEHDLWHSRDSRTGFSTSSLRHVITTRSNRLHLKYTSIFRGNLTSEMWQCEGERKASWYNQVSWLEKG